MDALHAGVESALAVLPSLVILLQRREVALDHAALGHDLIAAQFAPLGDLQHLAAVREKMEQMLSDEQGKGAGKGS